MSPQSSGVVLEHAVLCRHMGGVQDRVSRLMREKEVALSALTSEVVRLRGQLVVTRTTLLWGMNTPVASIPHRSRASSTVPSQSGTAQDLEAARKAICQTGCAGHAHPWLSDDGQCRWSGRVCDGGSD
jgi:hypothetical protein